MTKKAIFLELPKYERKEEKVTVWMRSRNDWKKEGKEGSNEKEGSCLIKAEKRTRKNLRKGGVVKEEGEESSSFWISDLHWRKW